MKCPKCGAENPSGFTFCPQCGTKLIVVCPECSYTCPADFAFCPKCGAKLLAPPDRNQERLEQARRAMPPTLADKLLSAKERIKGERKQVTVMFADISGFTAMSELLDPEEVHTIMNDCFSVLGEIIYKYEGTIDKFIGDCVMALFGAPVTHEDDPERAIRAALEMLERLKRFNCELPIKLEQPLDMHIGINTGLVIAGEIGTDLRMDYTVIGDTVNLASRLEGAAERGQIFVSENTYRLSSRIFDFVAHEPLALKGKREPVAVYEIVKLKARPETMRGLEGISSPLVGRTREFAALQTSVERLRQGEGQIVSVIGEAGLGKSRLMAELRRSTVQRCADAVIWVEGRCLSYGRSMGYLVFREIIRKLLTVSPENEGGVVVATQERNIAARLREQIETLLPDRVLEIYPFLGHLLALELEMEMARRVRYLEGESLRRQLFYAVREFFTAIAREKPLVLVFDDIHWADPSSIDLLEYLMVATEQARLWLGCVYRPDKEADCWRLRTRAQRDFAPRYTETMLTPLSPADSQQLVSNLLSKAELPDQMRQLLLDRAEGNPFFVEEVIRSLIEVGSLKQERGKWQAVADDQTIVSDFQHLIPNTLQGVIMARVDRLEDELKRVLQLAAVIGRVFMYLVLEHIADHETELGGYLEHLQWTELIRARAEQPELTYIFKHALTQEAVYQSLLLRQRREFHRQVGAYVETTFADRIEEYYDLIAHHYERGEVWDKAAEYLIQAGEQKRAQYANREAIDYYQRALIALDRISEPSREFETRGKVEAVDRERRLMACHEGMGDAYYLLGEYDRALDAFQKWQSRWKGQSQRIAPTRGRMADVQRKVGRVYEQKGDYAEAHRWLGKAEAALGEPRDAAERAVAARIHIAHASVLHRQGEYQPALAECETALQLVEGAEQLEEMAQTYNILAVIYDDQGETDRALSYYHQSLELRRQMGDSYQVGRACNNLGTTYVRRGNLDKSAELYEEALRIGEQLEDQSGIAFACINLGETRACQGQYTAATRHYHRALEILERIGQRHFVAVTYNNLGFVCIEQRYWAQAQANLEKSARIFTELGSREYLAENYRGLAAVQVGLGDAERALEYAQRAVQEAQELGRRFEEGVARRVMGEAHRLRGENEVAERCLRDSLAILEELQSQYEIGRSLWQLARLYQETGRGEEAERYGAQAREIFARLGARADLERVEAVFPSHPVEVTPWIQQVSSEEFAAHVKEALERLEQLSRLAESPLLGLRLLDARLRVGANGRSPLQSNRMARVEALQALLIELVEELETAPGKAAQWYQVLYHTYLQRQESNEAIAARLHLSSATFYRYLKQGQQAVAARLRELESLRH